MRVRFPARRRQLLAALLIGLALGSAAFAAEPARPGASKAPAHAASAAPRPAKSSAAASSRSASDATTPAKPQEEGDAAISRPALGALLLALAAAVIGWALWYLPRRRRAAPQGRAAVPQGADAPRTPPQYNPAKVGNDASARPWESGFAPPEDTLAQSPHIDPALAGSGWGIPLDFDVAGFTAEIKRNFIALQTARDQGDIPALRAMMTDEVLAETQQQLAGHAGSAGETEVALLDAQLLGIEELPEARIASVEFSGVIREGRSAGARPFHEVWNLIQPRHGPGNWRVAGMQAMQ